MPKKLIHTILSILLILSYALSASPAVFAENKTDKISVQQQVYNFLTGEMALCPAAAAGIMGNIMIESGFDPTVEAPDVDGLPSFGLIMWHGARYEALKSWCKDKGYDKTDVNAQLGWLKYELENTEKPSYAAMKKIPNTMEGAVQAAIQWAELFERCTKRSYYLRILYAVNTYWPDYAGGSVSETPEIYGYYFNVPENVEVGKPLTIIGTVVSYTSPLNSLTVTVYDKNGITMEEETIVRGVSAYNINILDRSIIFNRIPEGSYTYAITADTESGPVLIGRYPFTVSREPTKDKLIYEVAAEAACSGGAVCPGIGFTDMPSVTSWAHEGIDSAVKRGLFQGTTPSTFEPDGKMTRAMFVTVLWRLAGSPEPNSADCPYTDVRSGSYYEKAVLWASKAGVTNGVSEDAFAPESIITREMFVTLLHRYDGLDTDTTEPGTTEPDTTDPETLPKNERDYDTSLLDKFPDAKDVSGWAAEAMAWAIGEGIVSGNVSITGEVLIDPNGASTRAQVAVMLTRYIDSSNKVTE